ncbi:hypothetical protein MFIFM68171_09987 [Madurella fahalii]|uniref:Uncharacterized protein n=1 Tax=Madurella fahalii TaxID=1157608 RepID=A0ABQ0GPW9_9PEZI
MQQTLHLLNGGRVAAAAAARKQVSTVPAPAGPGSFTKVERLGNRVLREQTYYFVDDATDNKYPVIPSFDHWRFPHDNPPNNWKDLKIPVPPPSILALLVDLEASRPGHATSLAALRLAFRC